MSASTPGSLSSREPLCFWGWGYAAESLTAQENALIEQTVKQFVPGGVVEVAPPTADEFTLAPSRLALPDAWSGFVSTQPYDRLVHCYGKSYGDMLRMLLRDAGHAPDAVAFPRNEEQIGELMDFAAEQDVALIPYGGGTSVCGGVEADVGPDYRGSISVDMQHFNRILEVDTLSRRARVQAGILGPDLEDGLRPHGLTLRHFPQSFRFSTLGGWIATRAGGHFATVYTHIDDLVESCRLLTPRGVIQTRALPGSGAGPSADRLILGSEGVLGLITEATVRLQARPRWRRGATVRFPSMAQGATAVRQLAQSGLYPSNCRLLDEAEVLLNRLANRPCALLVLGFESADHPVDAAMGRALEIVAEHDGAVQEEPAKGEAGDRDEQAEAWRNAFIRMPYYRNRLAAMGVIADTFESAITWDAFPAFYQAVRQELGRVIQQVTGKPYMLSCRFTHVYPDGPAPYFTIYAVGDTQGQLEGALDKWRQIKREANRLVVEHGGTITHHHAVGRDHRSGYEAQTSPLYRQSLAATKAFLDPAAVLNPGALIDPQGRAVGQRGVLGPGS